MSVSLRAAAFAVATFAVAATATIARPSLAWEADAAPAVPAFAVHSAAAIQDGTSPINPIDSAGEMPAATSLPITKHAVAQLGADEDAIEVEAEEKSLAPVKTLSALVDDHDERDLDAEMECLAGAVYFESKGEPLEGQLAVAEVIINRAKSGRFPASYCGVVKQRGQFSFVRGGKFPPIARGSAHWRKAVGVAHVAAQDLADSKVDDALFFHARRVSPGWKLKRLATVGNHIFYR
ncbi:cell wall hydrolase [Allosphingosinicella vermicomposti]|uniref:cell wall hydrolase n=1 Tax=Allosphingosinicella vermicomposti TaxID=614671 RepID=UPI000D101CC8|nr:cell wall hydrolase [Allosphingosinicella vermicomposti]